MPEPSLAATERLLEGLLRGDVLRERDEAAHLPLGPEVGRVGGADLDRRSALPLHLGLEGDGATLEGGPHVRTDPGVDLLAHHLAQRPSVNLESRPEVVGLVEAVAEDVALLAVDVHERRGHGVQDEPQPFRVAPRPAHPPGPALQLSRQPSVSR